jgi:hypothetical protein
VKNLHKIVETSGLPEATTIVKRMQKTAQEIEDARKDKEPTTEAVLPDPPYCQLDLWPEPERGSPNTFLRSALFAAIQSEKRQVLQGPQTSPTKKPRGVGITSQAGFAIEYAGVQLDQYDLDVWLQSIHLARCQPLGTDCEFRGSAFLKAIGRKNGFAQYEDLNESLDRLTSGDVVIKQESLVFTGHLISNYVRDERTRRYKVTFAEEILKLFGYASWTGLQWEERRKLRGKNLALWLHGYYSSHAKPYPVTVQFLHKLCGSRAQQLKHFKVELKKAFLLLEDKAGIKATYHGDLVSVERVPSPAQAKHLAQKSDAPQPTKFR